MNYFSNLSRISLSTVTLFLGIGMSGFVSVLSVSQADPEGCNVSPDNSGCILNRPVDIERRQKQSQSQDILLFESTEIQSNVMFEDE